MSIGRSGDETQHGDHPPDVRDSPHGIWRIKVVVENGGVESKIVGCAK